MMPDSFEKREDIGRHLFERWVLSRFPSDQYQVQLEFTKDKYADNDAFLTVVNKKNRRQHDYVVEIKVRGKHYQTLILEEDKYKRLMRQADNEDAECLYVNFTERGAFTFNLSKMDIGNWEYRDLIYHTCNPSDGEKKKLITYLNTDQADFLYIRDEFDI